MAKKNTYFICIDGGGTKSRSIIFNSDHKILKKNLQGSCNIETNLNESLLNIKKHISNLTANLNCPQSEIILSMGLAGGRNYKSRSILKKKFSNFKKIIISTDGHITLLSSSLNKEVDIIKIASINLGTGTTVNYFKNKKYQEQISGWGYLFGDQCSGSWIGKELVSLYLQRVDNLIPEDPVFKDIHKIFGDRESKIYKNVSSLDPKKISELVNIFKKYIKKSPICKKICRQSLFELEIIIKFLLNKKNKEIIYLSGGLSIFYFNIVSKKFKKYICLNKIDPLYGALLMAENKYLREHLFNDIYLIII